jgi:hypothetical protein
VLSALRIDWQVLLERIAVGFFQALSQVAARSRSSNSMQFALIEFS